MLFRSLNYRTVTPSIAGQRLSAPLTAADSSSIEGAYDSLYGFAERRVEHVLHPSGIPVGYWRSVGPSITCFAVESAMDQAAAVAGVDPVTFRKGMLPSRVTALLDSVVAQMGWDPANPIPAASGRGVAISNGFASYVAVAVEVTKDAVLGTMIVSKVAVAIDCGIVTNSDQVIAQMQGGVIHGISSALWGQTTFSNGKASSRNFSNTRVLRMKETPQILVNMIDHREIGRAHV